MCQSSEVGDSHITHSSLVSGHRVTGEQEAETVD
jgi:hypothetical protein